MKFYGILTMCQFLIGKVQQPISSASINHATPFYPSQSIFSPQKVRRPVFLILKKSL